MWEDVALERLARGVVVHVRPAALVPLEPLVGQIGEARALNLGRHVRRPPALALSDGINAFLEERFHSIALDAGVRERNAADGVTPLGTGVPVLHPPA